MKNFIWCETSKGNFAFGDLNEFNDFKKTNKFLQIRTCGNYEADNIAEVYAAKNSERENFVKGVGAPKPFANKNAQYWRDVRRKKYGKYREYGGERTFVLTDAQMKLHKAHPEISLEEITGSDGLERRIKVIREEAPKKEAEKKQETKSSYVPPEVRYKRRKVINRIQKINPPRDTPLPDMAWYVDKNWRLIIFGTTYSREEGLDVVAKFYPLDYDVIKTALEKSKI